MGQQAGTRKATAPPHVKLSWPRLHLAGGKIAGSGSASSRQPGQEGKMACLEPGIGRRLIRGQLAPASLQSGLSSHLSGEPTTLKLPTAAVQQYYIEQSLTLNLLLLLQSF